MARRFTFVLAVVIAGGVAYALTNLPSAAEDSGPAPRTMTITGMGTASGKPDVATINIGVQSDAKTASAALADNSAKMRRLLQELQAQGIEEKFIQTSNFNVSPLYGKYDQTTQSSPLIGYRVNNEVHVTVKDIAKMGPVLDKVVEQGANRIHGISFGFSNSQPLMDSAREAAVTEARRKAELFAKAAGVRVGEILTFNENYSSGPQPVQARAMMDSAEGAPIAVGESELSATVSIVFEIK